MCHSAHPPEPGQWRPKTTACCWVCLVHLPSISVMDATGWTAGDPSEMGTSRVNPASRADLNQPQRLRHVRGPHVDRSAVTPSRIRDAPSTRGTYTKQWSTVVQGISQSQSQGPARWVSSWTLDRGPVRGGSQGERTACIAILLHPFAGVGKLVGDRQKCTRRAVRNSPLALDLIPRERPTLAVGSLWHCPPLPRWRLTLRRIETP